MQKFLLCALILVLIFNWGECASCGKPVRQPSINLDGSRQRVVGGVNANPHSYPWIVSLQDRSGHNCGGSLISVNDRDSTDIVVTAAHCVVLATPTLVKVSAHSLADPAANEQTLEIASSVPHPGFKPSVNRHNDIAVIKLKKPVKFSDTIQPICLPDGNEQLANGTRTVAAGWGALDSARLQFPDILQQAMLPIVDGQPCSSQYENPDDGDAMFCAGVMAGGQGVCVGDSGGPLMSKLDGSYILSGVVSWGKECAERNQPTFFTRVPKYVNWITETSKNITSVQ